MENIAIIDSRFYEFSDLVLSEVANMHILEMCVFSDNYLEAKPLPTSFKCIPLEDNDFVPQNVVNKFRELCEYFKNAYNVEPKISVLYPSGGYIGWHTNANQNRYNAICTFSETGNGSFKYIEEDIIIEVKDKKGWSVKESMWFDNSIQHMAYTQCNRITIAFTSEDKEDIDNLIKNVIK